MGATALLLAGLASGLPADTFYTGDPGVKLVAVRHALAQPGRPLELPLPAIAGEPAPALNPFYARHGSHSHAITSELFPLATAPLAGLFGIRGVYVLPAAGFLLTLAACAWLGITLDPRRNAAAIVGTAVVSTPLLFYGLEFWEHAPAVGAAALATALFVRSTGVGVPALAGALFGVAALLRPETIWFAVAVLVSATWLPGRPGARQILAVAGGFFVVLVPLVVYTLAHFGTLLTPHVAGNPALWGPGWIGRRGAILLTWFWSIGPATAWIVAPAALLSLVPLPRTCKRRGRSFLIAVALLSAALITLTAPNDGGGQWGPRYLLVVCVPLVILAADVLEMLVRTRGRAGLVVAVVVCLTGAAIQRMSYQRLRGTKETYGRILDFVTASAPAGGFIVTDLWWLEQVAAAAEDRRFLFAPDGVIGATIVQRLDATRERTVIVVRSRGESPDQSAWLDGTCYGEGERREIPERTLVAIPLERRCN